jgi:hypothetical protein
MTTGVVTSVHSAFYVKVNPASGIAGSSTPVWTSGDFGLPVVAQPLVAAAPRLVSVLPFLLAALDHR